MTDYKLYSFDVFDTLLLRNTKSEPFRFFEIAQRCANFFHDSGYTASAYDFLLARYMATETSYRLSDTIEGCREGSLEEIHRTQLSNLQIPFDRWKEALQIEIDYEIENVSFNSPLWDEYVRIAKKLNATIIVISDTYMEGEYIRKILKHHRPDFFKACKKLYSSADYTVSKASGHLFEIAAKEFGVQPSDCLHQGDNFVTDFKNPKQKGWDANYLPIPENKRVRTQKDLLSFRQDLRQQHILIPQIERAV